MVQQYCFVYVICNLWRYIYIKVCKRENGNTPRANGGGAQADSRREGEGSTSINWTTHEYKLDDPTSFDLATRNKHY